MRQHSPQSSKSINNINHLMQFIKNLKQKYAKKSSQLCGQKDLACKKINDIYEDFRIISIIGYAGFGH